MERELELAYGMTEQDYNERMDFGPDADEEFDNIYNDEFAPEDDIDPAFDYGEMDYDPSDEGDLHGGWYDE